MKTAGINAEMAMDATNLTQLSSREQLSALMDGALSADETRFLLRRLQHDASLAESWERWRLSAEVMRGLAPTQRLPADFASRVAASLRDDKETRSEEQHIEQQHQTAGRRTVRSSTWLRWGGGAAVAASLAVVALINQPVVMESPGSLSETATVAAALSPATVPKTPVPQSPAPDPNGVDVESQTAALASAVAVIARPTRNNRRNGPSRAMQVAAVQATSVKAHTNTVAPVDIGLASTSNNVPLLPQADIITRPWPRSVLPHNGGPGLAVGFGDNARYAAPYNPFQVRTGIGDLPTTLIVGPPAGNAATPANDGDGGAVSREPQS